MSGLLIGFNIQPRNPTTGRHASARVAFGVPHPRQQQPFTPRGDSIARGFSHGSRIAAVKIKGFAVFSCQDRVVSVFAAALAAGNRLRRVQHVVTVGVG